MFASRIRLHFASRRGAAAAGLICPCWVLLAAVLLSGHLAAAPAAGSDRPNIVWIMSEDNSKHYLRHFDNDGAPTPHIEALAQHGITFDRAFSNSPVCSVARTTLITSCYAPRVGTQFHRRSEFANLTGTLKMFPAYLREAGYYTTNNRKEDYNAVKSPDPWDDSSGTASWKNRPDDSTPFFHVETHANSHESSLHFDVHAMQKPTDTDPSSVSLQPYFPDTATFRYTRARYHDRIGVIDGIVGDVVQDLSEAGVLEDTFVFYFGDHGGVLPRSKGYAYESGLHVPLVVRMPQRFRHLVDRSLGSRTGGFVGFVDFGPTVLNLAGVEPPSGIDGRAFLGPGVDSAEVDRRREAIGYADRFDEKYELVRTLRQGRWKYIRNFEAFLPDALQNNYRYRMLAYQQWREMYRAGELDSIQRQFFEPKPAELLFDLESDPHEVRNLSGDPQHRERLIAMRKQLTRRLKRWPDLSFIPEGVLVRDDAFDHPVAYGRSHADRIGRLVDTANLALLPAEDALPRLRESLPADDPWIRYWAAIACSCLGDDVAELRRQISELLDDPEPLVAARAAECMAVLGRAGVDVDDPRDVLYGAIRRAENEPAALQMLNTAVYMHDHTGGRYPIETDRIRFGFEPRRRSELLRRTEYLRQSEAERR